MTSGERLSLAILLKPFALLVFFCALAAVRVSIQRWMPDSRLKRILLFKV